VAMECFWNDGSKTQYYYVILDRLRDRSGELERAPESRIRGPLTRALEGVQLEGPEKNILREIHQGNQKGDQEEPVAKAARELWQASGKTVRSVE